MPTGASSTHAPSPVAVPGDGVGYGMAAVRTAVPGWMRCSVGLAGDGVPGAAAAVQATPTGQVEMLADPDGTLDLGTLRSRAGAPVTGGQGALFVR